MAGITNAPFRRLCRTSRAGRAVRERDDHRPGPRRAQRQDAAYGPVRRRRADPVDPALRHRAPGHRRRRRLPGRSSAPITSTSTSAARSPRSPGRAAGGASGALRVVPRHRARRGPRRRRRRPSRSSCGSASTTACKPSWTRGWHRRGRGAAAVPAPRPHGRAALLGPGGLGRRLRRSRPPSRRPGAGQRRHLGGRDALAWSTPRGATASSWAEAAWAARGCSATWRWRSPAGAEGSSSAPAKSRHHGLAAGLLAEINWDASLPPISASTWLVQGYPGEGDTRKHAIGLLPSPRASTPRAAGISGAPPARPRRRGPQLLRIDARVVVPQTRHLVEREPLRDVRVLLPAEIVGREELVDRALHPASWSGRVTCSVTSSSTPPDDAPQLAGLTPISFWTEPAHAVVHVEPRAIRHAALVDVLEESCRRSARRPP